MLEEGMEVKLHLLRRKQKTLLRNFRAIRA
jgi:hypothetical protein